MRDQKSYCKPGESESYIALGWVILLFILTALLGFVGIASIVL